MRAILMQFDIANQETHQRRHLRPVEIRNGVPVRYYRHPDTFLLSEQPQWVQDRILGIRRLLRLVLDIEAGPDADT